MPATHCFIFYSVSTGRVRRVVFPDNDSDLQFHPCGQGEAVLTYPQHSNGGLVNHQAVVNATTNIIPNNDQYALIDSTQTDDAGNYLIIGNLMCDPDGCGDSVIGSDGQTPCMMIANSIATNGWTYTPPPQNFSMSKVEVEIQQIGTFNPPPSPSPLTADQIDAAQQLAAEYQQ